jgi:polyhydroxyalkanoate synthesis regulator phasin
MAERSGSSGGRSSGGRRSSGSSGRSKSSRARSSSARSGTSARSKSSGARSGTSARSKSSGSSSSRAKSSSARARSGSASPAKRKAAAKKGGQARGRQQKAQKGARGAGRAAAKPARAAGFSGKTVAELRDAISKGVVGPLNLVFLSRERVEEVLGDAVKRGRVQADDAQDLVQRLMTRGRKQTNDVLSDLEQLLGDPRAAVKTARKRGRSAAKKGRTRVRDAVEPALAQADRARRSVGVGPNFPILGYDELTAAQVQKRLDGLTPAELRKVRDYERRNANRKSVLDAVESKLS